MMRLKKLVVALSAGAVFALAACTGSDGTSPSPPPSSNPSTDAGAAVGAGKDPNRRPPAAPIPGARRGGTLTVLSAAGLTSMDPTDAYYTDTASILSGLVTRSLTQYVYDQASEQMILVPDLATDLGRPSPDFKTWTFTLRTGVKFENGRPVTPEDIKFGIERSLDRDTFPGGANYSNTYFLHGDTYQGPYTSPGPYNGVTIDGMTITIHMSTPFPDMSYWGAFPAMGPIPAGKASDPATYKNHPWATGPYMFKDYTPEKSLTLVRNPYWDADTDPGRHQYVDGFEFDFDTDSAKIDQIMLADTGAGQSTISYDNVLAADYHEFSTTASDRLVTGSTSCTSILAPDNRKITDIRVRRALAYAYPYQEVWATSGHIPGLTQLPASNIMPPGIPGRVEYNPLPGHTPGSTLPAQAKELLRAAGKLNYPIRFAYASDLPGAVAVKNVLVKALKAAGFDPQPVPSTVEMFNEIQVNPRSPLNVRFSGGCSDWPSGSGWLPWLLQSSDIASVGLGSNYSAFSSPDVDARMDAIPNLLLTQQPAAWNALDKRIQTRYFPVIIIGYGGVAMMRGSKVHNDFDDTTYGLPTWKDIWLD
jgi:peptide/nickel transport system substrate-binding protein